MLIFRLKHTCVSPLTSRLDLFGPTLKARACDDCICQKQWSKAFQHLSAHFHGAKSRHAVSHSDWGNGEPAAGEMDEYGLEVVLGRKGKTAGGS